MTEQEAYEQAARYDTPEKQTVLLARFDKKAREFSDALADAKRALQSAPDEQTRIRLQALVADGNVIQGRLDWIRDAVVGAGVGWDAVQAAMPQFQIVDTIADQIREWFNFGAVGAILIGGAIIGAIIWALALMTGWLTDYKKEMAFYDEVQTLVQSGMPAQQAHQLAASRQIKLAQSGWSGTLRILAISGVALGLVYFLARKK